MGLETATTIGSLVATNPLSTDPKSEGDDHLRTIKAVLQADAVVKSASNTFTGTQVMSILQVTGQATISSLTVTGGTTLSTLAVLSSLRVDGNATISSMVVLGTISALGLYLTGTITATNQAASKTYVDGAISTIYSVPRRQTILYGAQTFLQIGTGLAVNLLATTKPVGFSYAAGFGAYGAIDYAGRFASDQASYWSGLTANNTNYLFSARDASTGAQTGVASLLPYIAQFSSVGSPSTTNGQHTYVIDEGQMYVGNGSVATAVQRTAVGECVAGASTITSVTSYALMGRYESADTAFAVSSAYSFSSNLGVVPKNIMLFAVCQTAENGYSIGDIIHLSPNDYDGTSTRGVNIFVHDRNTVKVATGSNNPYLVSGAGGSGGNLTFANWKIRVEAQRGW